MFLKLGQYPKLKIYTDNNILIAKLHHLFPNEYLILKGQQKSALAAALEIRQFYQQIYLARPIIPLSNKEAV